MKKPKLRENRILMILVATTGALLAAGAFVLWPAYINPESRIYTTALGYLKIQRLLGIKFHAEAEHPVWHDFETPLLGEGTMQCNFYNVPVVPLARLAAGSPETKPGAGEVTSDRTSSAGTGRSAT